MPPSRFRVRLLSLTAMALIALAGQASSQGLLYKALRPAGSAWDFGVAVTSASDMNGDGVPDMMVAARSDPHQPPFVHSLHAFSGFDGSPIRTVGFTTGMDLFAISLGSADVTMDGTPDFVVLSKSTTSPGGRLHAFSGKGGGELWYQTNVGYSPSQLLVIDDADADGIRDILVTAVNSGLGQVTVISGFNGTIIMSYQETQWPPGPAPLGRAAAIIGDVNGDGKADVALSEGVDKIQVMSIKNSSTNVLFRVPTGIPFIMNAWFNIAGPGDLDGDSTPDIACALNNGTTEIIRMFSGKTAAVIRDIPGHGVGLTAVGDTDGDGIGDLLFSIDNNLPPTLGLYSGKTGARFWTFAGEGGTSARFPFSITGLGDISRDGRADFAIVGGERHVWAFGERFPATYTTFGVGCAGSAGIPKLSAGDLPRPGLPFSVKLSNAAPFRAAVMFVGSSDQQWGPWPLPYDLSFLTMTGCKLYVSVDVLAPFSTNLGTTTWGFTLPSDVTLFRKSFFTQAFIVDPTANLLGLIGSDGGKGTVGS